jgi:hypothetical protein
VNLEIGGGKAEVSSSVLKEKVCRSFILRVLQDRGLCELLLLIYIGRNRRYYLQRPLSIRTLSFLLPRFRIHILEPKVLIWDLPRCDYVCEEHTTENRHQCILVQVCEALQFSIPTLPSPS